jgi:hypothetical protein
LREATLIVAYIFLFFFFAVSNTLWYSLLTVYCRKYLVEATKEASNSYNEAV